MQSVAEPVAVVPVNAGLVGNKGNGGGLLWADFHAHTVVHHTETVRYVFDHIEVGDGYGNFSHLGLLQTR